ncbi:MraY family glycosyltransferase [Endozoicomonas sp.]|uniref:MraY family glycosyltransferase n=1 Tax=Endozoicomonas sp. TaxID=1892382 RepID=UPI003AF76B17
MDKPGGRKQHDEATPMIGGVALFFTVTVTSLIWGKAGAELYYFLAAAALMVFTGAYDDRFGLGVRIRLLAEVIAACMMIFGAGVVLSDLGNLFGFGNIHMPMFIAVPFTIIAVFGTINCLNMIDGIDGLAAGLCLLSMCTFVVLLGDTGSSLVPIISIIAGLGAFLAFNLQLYPGFKKVFLGDAGSMLLGFTLVWLLIRSSQDYLPLRPAFIEPATALFVLGLPLMDMVATTIRRSMRGKNPFMPDRSHVHHVLLDKGYSTGVVLVFLLVAQLIVNAFGVFLHTYEVRESFQLFVFLGLFCVYFAFIVKVSGTKLGVMSKKYRLKKDIVFESKSSAAKKTEIENGE